MRRILLIDDDPSVRKMVATMLSDGGFEVVDVADAAIALKDFDLPRFDLLVVDIFMPGLDGFEIIEAFHARAPQVPILAMSGLIFQRVQGGPPDFEQMALDLGATRSLHKPFRRAQLMAAVHECLDGRRV